MKTIQQLVTLFLFILYGALVGGPEELSDDFKNDRGNWVSNEVALDYNAGFQGLLAAQIQLKPPEAERACNGKIIPTEKPNAENLTLEDMINDRISQSTSENLKTTTTISTTTTTKTTTTTTTTTPVLNIPDASLNFQTITFVS